MIFSIIFAVILLITLIALIYNIVIGVQTDDDKVLVIYAACAGIVGMMFGVILGSILFNI